MKKNSKRTTQRKRRGGTRTNPLPPLSESYLRSQKLPPLSESYHLPSNRPLPLPKPKSYHRKTIKVSKSKYLPKIMTKEEYHTKIN